MKLQIPLSKLFVERGLWIDSLKAYGTYGVSVLWLTISSLLIVFFLIRHLAPENYGQIVLFKSLFLIISSVGGVGISQSVVHLENKGLAPEDLLDVATTTALSLSVICSSVLCFLFLFFFEQELPVTAPIFCVAVFCLFGLFQVNNEIINFKRAKRLTSSYLKGALIRGGASLVFIILFVQFIPNTFGFILGQISAEALFCAGYLVIEKIRIAYNFKVVWSLLKFGWPHSLTISSGFAMNYVDRHVILLKTGQLDLVAFYDAVSLLAMSLVSTLSRPYNLFLLPVVTKKYFANGKDEANQFLQKTQLLYVTLVLALATVIAVNLDWIISMLFGEKYKMAAPIFPIIIFCVVLNSLVMSFMPLFNVVGKTRYLGYLAVVSVIVNIAFTVVLVPIYGLVGGALGVATASLVQYLVALILVKYSLQSPINAVLFSLPIIWLCLILQFS